MCMALQSLLVRLVRGGRAVGCRQSAGGESGPAGTHVIEVSGKLGLPGLLSQRLPDSCCFSWTAGQGGAGTDMESIPGPSRGDDRESKSE